MSALDALDDEQRAAASVLRGPVRVLAGAGTGKTRVITHRIAHGVDTGAYTPNRVMAVTFTSKAAGEMRGRLRALGVPGVAARTFHAAALSQLNYFWPTVAGGAPAPSIIDNKVRLLAQAADSVRLRLDTATLRDIASQIEWRKVAMVSIDGWARSGRGVAGLAPDAVVSVMSAYESIKDARHQLDFEDVLLSCAGMLEAEPRVTATVREQYRHFTVDEYQDVSPLQHRLLQLWVGERRDLCVVGDASQTIFSFAGADARFLLEFKQEHPEAKEFALERNYRSDPSVLNVANDLMRSRPGALELRATREGSSPVTKAVAHEDDEAEAAAVAASIARQIAQGARPADIAVLYRAQVQSALISQALAARGIAANVLGGKRYFEQPEVRQAVLSLRASLLAPPSDDVEIATRTVLTDLGFTEEPPPAGGALRDQWENRAALLRLAQNAAPGTSLRGFVDDLVARGRDQHEPSVDTVTLATLHAAKGLEWAHVHLIGWSEGLLPISYATTFEAVDEERRLAYVGVTRAAQSLSLTWSRSNGRQQRKPSRFLQEIGTHSLRVVGGAARVAGAPRGR